MLHFDILKNSLDSRTGIEPARVEWVSFLSNFEDSSYNYFLKKKISHIRGRDSQPTSQSAADWLQQKRAWNLKPFMSKQIHVFSQD